MKLLAVHKMESTPKKNISLRSTPKGKIILNDSDSTPKKVRFSCLPDNKTSIHEGKDKLYKAEDVLSMLNDSSLSDDASSSDEEWIITKSKALSISDSPLNSNGLNFKNSTTTPLKNAIVRISPLKVLSKDENNVTSCKTFKLSVSPIVLKRKTESRQTCDAASSPLTPSRFNSSDNLQSSVRRSQRRKPTSVLNDSDYEISPPKRRPKPVVKYYSDTENECSPPKRKAMPSSNDVSPECTEKVSTLRTSARKKTGFIVSPDVMIKAHTPRSLAQKNLEISSPLIAEAVSDLAPESPKGSKIIRTPRRSVRKKLELSTPNKCCEDDSSSNDLDGSEVFKTPRRKSKVLQGVTTDSPSLRRQVLTPKTSAKKLEWSSPGSTKKIGSGFLSPVVQERTKRSLLGSPSSRLDLVRASLHTSNVPASLPCREKEFNSILSFTMRKIEAKAGGCMYISGVPGTGKTATVHGVIKLLQEKAKEKELVKFDFVEINGLRLTEPKQAYTRIWQELSGNKCSAEMAMSELEKKFIKKCKCSTVILVDELDYLCNRRQDVIYNILEWSTKSTASLTVITIANTMDLPERTLKGKVTSRMGLTRLVFQPYTFQQLQQIVLNRIGSNSNFHVDAIQLVARKVAAVSGDARRALDICRRATELISSETDVVKVSHIEDALTQIFSGTRVQAIKKCNILSQYLLRAMRDEFHRTGVEETTINDVYLQFSAIATLEGYEVPPIGTLLGMTSVLADSGLILAEKCRSDLNRKLFLNVSSDDIYYALSC